MVFKKKLWNHLKHVKHLQHMTFFTLKKKKETQRKIYEVPQCMLGGWFPLFLLGVEPK